MNEFPRRLQDHSEALARAYGEERARLAAFAESDAPQGDYLHPVFGEGDERDAAVLFIGEAPGGEEAASGRPFVGKAGKQLDSLLALAAIPRERVYITNAVKYRPVTRSAKSVRNRTPGTKEILAALPLLTLEIRLVRPRCIVTLGNTPLFSVLRLGCREKATIGDLHGRATPVVIGDWESALFPLYHPASGIYNHALVPIMEQDIRALSEHLVKAP